MNLIKALLIIMANTLFVLTSPIWIIPIFVISTTLGAFKNIGWAKDVAKGRKFLWRI